MSLFFIHDSPVCVGVRQNDQSYCSWPLNESRG